jgi:hypothetical protein
MAQSSMTKPLAIESLFLSGPSNPLSGPTRLSNLEQAENIGSGRSGQHRFTLAPISFFARRLFGESAEWTE